MIWSIVDELRRLGTALAQSAIAAWVLVMPLAYIFDWLEQPPFMLLVALVTGLAFTEAHTAAVSESSSSLLTPIMHQARAHAFVVLGAATIAVCGAWASTHRQRDEVVASLQLVIVDDADALGQIIDGGNADGRLEFVEAMARSAAFVEATADLEAIAPVSVEVGDSLIELSVVGGIDEAEALIQAYADALIAVMQGPYDDLVLEQVAMIDGRAPVSDPIGVASLTVERSLLARLLALEERREELLTRSRIVGTSVIRDGSVLVEPASTTPRVLLLGLALLLGTGWSVSLLSIRHLASERVFSLDDLLRSYRDVQPIDWTAGPVDADSPAVRAIARRLMRDLPLHHGTEVTVVELGRSRARSHMVAEHLTRALELESGTRSPIRVSNSTGRDSDRGAAGLVLLVEKGEVALVELDRLVAEWTATGTALMGLVLYGRTPALQNRDGGRVS